MNMIKQLYYRTDRALRHTDILYASGARNVYATSRILKEIKDKLHTL
jgi:hypothetical protein